MAIRSLAFLTGGSEMELLESFGEEPGVDDLAGLLSPPSTEEQSFILVRGGVVFSC